MGENIELWLQHGFEVDLLEACDDLWSTGSSLLRIKVQEKKHQLRRSGLIDCYDGVNGFVDVKEAACASTWMAFGGNTRDLDSICEETDKNSTLHEIGYQKGIQTVETASQFLATASED
ncbi:hypothetical protein Tco_1064220 [Tanacetum coccineum]